MRHAGAVLRGRHPSARLAALRDRLAALEPRALAATTRRLQERTRQLHALARSLEAVSPLATVARGYAILQHADGRVVRRREDAHAGDRLDARLQDGTLRVRVEDEGA